MSVNEAVRRGRELAESLMQDRFRAYSPTGRGKNPATGLEEMQYAVEYETEGKAAGRSRESDTNARTVTIGGVARLVVEGGVHIPISKPIPVAGAAEGKGWEYECIEAGPDSDPSIVGRRWRVIDAPAKSYATARRLDVVEL